MKKLNLLILTAAAATLMTWNLSASDALLTPRAKDNQAKPAKTELAGSAVTSPAYATGAPRAVDQQTKKGAGTVDTQAMSCSRNMTSSPKAAGECAGHPGVAMPCCAVANSK